MSCRPSGYEYVGFALATPPLEVIVVLILLTLMCLVCHFMRTALYDAKGRRIPGPKLSDFPMNKLRHARKNKRVAELLHECMINKWGDGKLCGMRALGRKVCFLAHPDDVKIILAGSHSAFPKAQRYTRLKFVLNEGLVTSSGKVWQTHRRIINKGFQATKYGNFVKVFAEKTELAIEEILGRMIGEDVTQAEIDLTKILGLLSYRIICKAGFGYEPDTTLINSSGFSPDTVTLILDEINVRLSHLTDWGHYLDVYRERRVNKTLADMDEVIFKIIANRRASMEEEENEKGVADAAGEREAEDLLDILMRASFEEKSLSARDLRDHIFTFLAAGTETTATTTAWLLLELCLNKEVQAKCAAEVTSIFGGREKQRRVTYEDIDKLVYLEAAMKEALRLHPPASVVARSCKEDTTLASGYTLPAGTSAIVSIYSLHHNELLWENATEFKPERFLPEYIHSTVHSPWMYLPFAAGPRNCIGQRFAKYEVLSVVASLLGSFSVSMSASALARYRIEETVVRRPVDLHMTFTKK